LPLLLVAVAATAAIGLFVANRDDGLPADELTAEGIGPLRIGMSFDDAVDTGWVDDDRDDTFGSACYYASLTNQAGREGDFDEDRVGMIFLDDELALISTYDYEDSPDDLGASGPIEMGDSEEDVLDELGDDAEEYEDEYGTAHIQLIDEQADVGLDFSFDDSDRVVGIEAGSEDGLGLIEGCA